MRYSDAIVEHYGETGDKPAPALEALAAVHGLVQNVGYENFGIDTEGDFLAVDNVRVTFNGFDSVTVESGDHQKNRKEKFTLSMFNGASYEVTEMQKDGDEDFDDVSTTKWRILESKDVERLKEVLAPAIEQKRLDDEAQYQDDDEERRLQEEAHQDDDFGDDSVTPGDILRRARAHFGNTEEAEEAARMFPGDFM